MKKTDLEIYQDLMALCTENEINGVNIEDAFYFQDFALEGSDSTLRIFNYRMAGYTQFQLPSALECRGIMFWVDVDGNFISLVCFPMEKFFNYRENPFAMYPDTTELYMNIEEVQVKEDGSLMSSYINPITNVLGIKSRGSIKSDQCIAAEVWLNVSSGHFADQVVALRTEVEQATRDGWTVNLEWCSPIHRIVLPYEHGHMRVLNMRCRMTGRYADKDLDIRTKYPHIAANMAQVESLDSFGDVMITQDFDDAFDALKVMTGREGYIFKLAQEFVDANPNHSRWFKGKTDWYCALHHSKDSVTNPRRLFECVMEDGTDDLRQMFMGNTPEETDHQALALIDAAEQKYGAIYNHQVATVEAFYEENKHLERKEFAIKGQEELEKKLGSFGLAMALYAGKKVDYKANLKKKWKSLGLKDEKVEDNNA